MNGRDTLLYPPMEISCDSVVWCYTINNNLFHPQVIHLFSSPTHMPNTLSLLDEELVYGHFSVGLRMSIRTLSRVYTLVYIHRVREIYRRARGAWYDTYCCCCSAWYTQYTLVTNKHIFWGAKVSWRATASRGQTRGRMASTRERRVPHTPPHNQCQEDRPRAVI